eukprot:6490763-Amphidinium_carterae.1
MTSAQHSTIMTPWNTSGHLFDMPTSTTWATSSPHMSSCTCTSLPLVWLTAQLQDLSEAAEQAAEFLDLAPDLLADFRVLKDICQRLCIHLPVAYILALVLFRYMLRKTTKAVHDRLLRCLRSPEEVQHFATHTTLVVDLTSSPSPWRPNLDRHHVRRQSSLEDYFISGGAKQTACTGETSSSNFSWEEFIVHDPALVVGSTEGDCLFSSIGYLVKCLLGLQFDDSELRILTQQLLLHADAADTHIMGLNIASWAAKTSMSTELYIRSTSTSFGQRWGNLCDLLVLANTLQAGIQVIDAFGRVIFRSRALSEVEGSWAILFRDRHFSVVDYSRFCQQTAAENAPRHEESNLCEGGARKKRRIRKKFVPQDSSIMEPLSPDGAVDPQDSSIMEPLSPDGAVDPALGLPREADFHDDSFGDLFLQGCTQTDTDALDFHTAYVMRPASLWNVWVRNKPLYGFRVHFRDHATVADIVHRLARHLRIGRSRLTLELEDSDPQGRRIKLNDDLCVNELGSMVLVTDWKAPPVRKRRAVRKRPAAHKQPSCGAQVADCDRDLVTVLRNCKDYLQDVLTRLSAEPDMSNSSVCAGGAGKQRLIMQAAVERASHVTGTVVPNGTLHMLLQAETRTPVAVLRARGLFQVKQVVVSALKRADLQEMATQLEQSKVADEPTSGQDTVPSTQRADTAHLPQTLRLEHMLPQAPLIPPCSPQPQQHHQQQQQPQLSTQQTQSAPPYPQPQPAAHYLPEASWVASGDLVGPWQVAQIYQQLQGVLNLTAAVHSNVVNLTSRMDSMAGLLHQIVTASRASETITTKTWDACKQLRLDHDEVCARARRLELWAAEARGSASVDACLEASDPQVELPIHAPPCPATGVLGRTCIEITSDDEPTRATMDEEESSVAEAVGLKTQVKSAKSWTVLPSGLLRGRGIWPSKPSKHVDCDGYEDVTMCEDRQGSMIGEQCVNSSSDAVETGDLRQTDASSASL